MLYLSTLSVKYIPPRNWALNKVSDTKGNYFTVSYHNDATLGQAYPTEIDYTGNAAANVPPYNKVTFVYSPPPPTPPARPDTITAYQSGSLISTTVRLTDIKTYTGSTLVADYNLTYHQSGSTQASEVFSITIYGGDGSTYLPSTYVNWSTGFTGVFAAPLHNTFGQDFKSPPGQYFLPVTGDFNGDGKAD